MRLTRLALGILAIVVCLGPNKLYAQPQAIDVNKSSLKIRVFKSGAFSAFTHDHEIQASINEGKIDSSASPSVGAARGLAQDACARPVDLRRQACRNPADKGRKCGSRFLDQILLLLPLPLEEHAERRPKLLTSAQKRKTTQPSIYNLSGRPALAAVT